MALILFGRFYFVKGNLFAEQRSASDEADPWPILLSCAIQPRGSFVELKSVAAIADVHKKHLLTFLRLLDYRVGLLLNFGAPLMKDGIERIANRV